MSPGTLNDHMAAVDELLVSIDAALLAGNVIDARRQLAELAELLRPARMKPLYRLSAIPGGSP